MQRIIHLEETGSTNADALRLALGGEVLPLWVVARRQTAGRGRAGRAWSSLDGNLQASCALVVAAPLTVAGQLSLVAGISLIEAVGRTLQLAEGVRVRLKWPNDLMIGAAKAGGILVESTTARGEPGFLAVIGFGVNVADAPEIPGRTVTALARHVAPGNTAPCADDLAEALTEETARWLGVWDRGRGFDAIRSAWMTRAGTLDEPITVHGRDGLVQGAYCGLASDGSLIVRVDGSERTISHGDVDLADAVARDGGA